MKTSLVILALVAAVNCQRGVDPRNAAILQEARYLAGDGSFGAAYVQEDGVAFKEETGQDGERSGQYSYVDPNGKTITVKYTAGKNGFQVSGDHLPRAPVPVQAPAPHVPAPQYNSAPRYNSIPQQPQQYNGVEDGQYNPAIHEHPYAYKEGSYSNNNNNNNNYVAPPQAPRQQPQQQYNTGFQQNNYQQQVYQTTTTPQPTRFFPPGKLDLNRTPDGYQFQFSSNGRN